MAKLNLTKTTENELRKQAKAEGFDSFEDYLVDKILIMLINNITASDVESTKKQIESLQAKLNDKREEILLELKEKKKVGE